MYQTLSVIETITQSAHNIFNQDQKFYRLFNLYSINIDERVQNQPKNYLTQVPKSNPQQTNILNQNLQNVSFFNHV